MNPGTFRGHCYGKYHCRLSWLLCPVRVSMSHQVPIQIGIVAVLRKVIFVFYCDYTFSLGFKKLQRNGLTWWYCNYIALSFSRSCLNSGVAAKTHTHRGEDRKNLIRINHT